jgi:hypothetical protein
MQTPAVPSTSQLGGGDEPLLLDDEPDELLPDDELDEPLLDDPLLDDELPLDDDPLDDELLELPSGVQHSTSAAPGQ